MKDERRFASPEEHHRILIQDKKEPSDLILRLRLTISYKLNGMTIDHMNEYLLNAVDHAVGNGLLTGESPAEVLSYRTTVEEVE